MTAALCSASLTTRGATAVRPAAFHLGSGLSRTAVIPSPARGGINSARNLSERFVARHGARRMTSVRGRLNRFTMNLHKMNTNLINEHCKRQGGGTPPYFL